MESIPGEIFDQVIAAFGLAGKVLSHAPYGHGHINRTFLLTTKEGNDDYILQKINRNIFPDINALMSNVATVTDYLSNQGGGRTPELKRTTQGNPFFTDQNGDCWRLFRFMAGTVIYEMIEDTDLAFEAGMAIGKFQGSLSGLNEDLTYTIESFHDFNYRWNQYEKAKAGSEKNRILKAGETMAFYESRAAGMKKYFQKLGSSGIPLRVTHNDTKVNNILFDSRGKAVCLIDLDTVMPGFIHFDYGDALRTLANTAAEDEKDLAKVSFNEDLFTGFTKGYLYYANHFLTGIEKEMLPLAPLYMTFLIGLRFLTDYLGGDQYFRISYLAHNLQRTKVQMMLLEDMERKSDRIRNEISLFSSSV